MIREYSEVTHREGSPTDRRILSVRELVEYALNNWFLLLLSSGICVALAWLYVQQQQPMYSHSVMLQIGSEKDYSNKDIVEMTEAMGTISGSGISDEVRILRSRKLLREVARRLDLSVTYSSEGLFRNTTLYGISPVKVEFLDPYTTFSRILLSPATNRDFRLGEEGPYPYGDTIATAAGRIVVTRQGDRPFKENVIVERTSLDDAAGRLFGSITANASEKGSSIVEITCHANSLLLIDDVLNTLVSAYTEAVIEHKNRLAVNTENFINKRIEIVGAQLGDVEEELTDFKQRNSLSDLPSLANQQLPDNSALTSERLQLETELAVANRVKTNLSEAKNDKMITGVQGYGLGNIDQMVQSYNELVMQHNRLLEESGSQNAVVEDLNRRLAEMRGVLTGMLDNYINNIYIRQEKLNSSERRNIVKLQNVPAQEQAVTEIMRRQSIKETLYIYLLNKREENALRLAIAEADIRVVETPFGPNAPIAPKGAPIMILAFCAGLCLPVMGRVIWLLWNTKVDSRREVEQLISVPVIGEIPKAPKSAGRPLAVKSEDTDSVITEAFRLLRYNLGFVAKDAKVIMVTSSLSGEGKTFLSLNLSATLAMSGKKVALVDLDLRRAKLSRDLEASRKMGVSSYLACQIDNVDEILSEGIAIDGVDFISSGPTPPNPAELLMGERLDRLVEELKKRYDYVVLDSVPAQIVADSAIVGRVADMVIYVIRTHKVDRRHLAEIEKLRHDEKFKQMYIVMNGCNVKRYGYGYGYGNYGYGYGYGDRKGRWRKHKK